MSASSTRESLYFVAPREVAVSEERVAAPAAGEVLVETLVSAISSGSELLVYRGEVPGGMALDATIPGLAKPFELPAKYGYSAVGRVTALGEGVAAQWLDRLVFSLHPHETSFVAPVRELFVVPADIGAEDAAMYPSVETAVNLLMDGRPLIGERVAVFGQGVVGLLTTALLARFPLSELVTFDRHAMRRRLSARLGARRALDVATGGEPAERDFDLVYELSGNPAALDAAIAVTGFDGRVVIGSWYGDQRAELHLGGAFHRSRIQLVSSQVSTIDPCRTGRFSFERRREVTWSLLSELQPGRLITHRFAFAAAAEAYELLDRRPDEAVQILLTYGA
jgi:2-desacetyl-2-hydroxyethyl bacteriochlorophyllide A dehydrogenase